MRDSSGCASSRVVYIDIARFYAMAMVFFGHFIERIMLLNDPTAAVLYKLIYSFHMVLFFMLSGFVARDGDLVSGLRGYLKSRFCSRLVPFIFFTFAGMGLAAVFPGEFFNLKLPSTQGYARGLVLTALGVPVFCVPTWFLLMLFSVEMIHFFAFRLMACGRSAPPAGGRLLIAIPLFYTAGYLLNLYGDFLNPAQGRMYNFLFIHEAITMYAFYLAGVYLRRINLLIAKTPMGIAALGAALAFLAVWFTFNLNQGPFNFNYYNAVVIMMAAHGHMLWFPVTALAGCLGVFLLGKITPAWSAVTWMGQNTLILMGLNGIFYHLINPGAAQWVLRRFPDQPAMILLFGLLATLASLALCAPLVHLLNRYLPQLTGRPKVDGPWLKAFVRPASQGSTP